MLPRRIPKPAKRATRWRSQAHASFVRSHACTNCGSTTAIEFAHVRLGSGAGISQKPSDHRGVSLCAPCHRRQHEIGEQTFWAGRDIEAIIEAFCRASPRAAEIRRVRSEASDA